MRINPIFIDNVISNKIDRTFVDQDGTRWIIDYKTSRHEEEDVDAFLDQQHDSMDGGGRNASGTAFEERYKEQLEKYGALMKLHDDKPIKLGLYFPLLQGWREWSMYSES